MTRELTGEVQIDVPAKVVWAILGENFSRIGDWASVIKRSEAITNGTPPAGADASGRYCTPAMPFVSEVTEQLVHFDETSKTFRYEATEGLPGFIHKAENTWRVIEDGPERCIVRTTGKLAMNPVLGSLLFPMFKLQLNRAGAQLVEELKYYAENGTPHPRKARQLGV